MFVLIPNECNITPKTEPRITFLNLSAVESIALGVDQEAKNKVIKLSTKEPEPITPKFLVVFNLFEGSQITLEFEDMQEGFRYSALLFTTFEPEGIVTPEGLEEVVSEIE